jgi:type I restriction-modification system DNA methylase subunit
MTTDSNAKEIALLGVKELVAKYREIEEAGKLASYNEAQTRNEFIEPMFEYLGWDMRNLRNKREVITEESVSSGRVDLSFQLQGIPVFFLEAKAIRVNLDEWKWAEQAINYSWNKSVSWAVLSDFEGVKIFNADLPPKNLASNLFLELKIEQFEEKFDDLWLLSKDSFLNQTLNLRAEKWRKSDKKTQVGQKLFEDLMTWRNLLTKQISKQNNTSIDDLNEGVQTILDRLIFIRTAEDRKIVGPSLEPILKAKSTNIYNDLKKLFIEFDKIFNSKLFSNHVCDKWEIESKTLSKIINGLYIEENGYKYDFSVITADVLGGMYEQYLSFVQNEKTDSTHKSKRKAQGIYYTPKYIVDFLLDESLEKLISQKGKSKQIKILDPACGSGSFLIAAYDRLVEAQNKVSQASLYDSFEILQESIYGVDIDEQAVEVAQLNLLLKALVQKTLLPTLRKNLRHGNSLIFGDAMELHDLFGQEIYENKPFDYVKELPNIFNSGGFDLIIGNPPYVFARGGSFETNVKDFFKNHYEVAQYQLNTYALFIERAFQLLKSDGYLAFIVPNTWLTIQSYSSLRKYLIENSSMLKVINIHDKVFSAANVDTCLLIAKKGKGCEVTLGEFIDGSMEIVGDYKGSDFPGPDYLINISLQKDVQGMSIVKKILENSKPLSDFCDVKTGLKAYQIGKGKPKQTEKQKATRVFHSLERIDDSHMKYLEGKDVKRYSLGWGGQWLKYGAFLAEPRSIDLFTGVRILVRQIPSKPPYSINATLVDEPVLNDINSMVIRNFRDIAPKFVLGVLNSKLTTYWFVNTFDKFQRKTFPQFKINELAMFPIFTTSKDYQDKVIKFVEGIEESQAHLTTVDEGSLRFGEIVKHMDALNNSLDKLIYEIAGLTEDEISIVESMS